MRVVPIKLSGLLVRGVRTLAALVVFAAAADNASAPAVTAVLGTGVAGRH